MKLIIDIPEEKYRHVISDYWCGNYGIQQIIKNGTLLPEGAEILTKEAYSDLCLRASKGASE